MSVLSEHRLVRIAGDAVACDFANGLALLDLECGTYFTLNSVGAFVWSQIGQPRRVGEICSAVVARYDVSPDRCRADVDSLLASLENSGLIEIEQDVYA